MTGSELRLFAYGQGACAIVALVGVFLLWGLAVTLIITGVAGMAVLVLLEMVGGKPTDGPGSDSP